MLAQPSMIKRPVLELAGGKLLVGFKPEEYANGLGLAASSLAGAFDGAQQLGHVPVSDMLASSNSGDR